MRKRRKVIYYLQSGNHWFETKNRATNFIKARNWKQVIRKAIKLAIITREDVEISQKYRTGPYKGKERVYWFRKESLKFYGVSS